MSSRVAHTVRMLALLVLLTPAAVGLASSVAAEEAATSANSAVLAWHDEIWGAAVWSGVPPDLLAAMIDLESGGDVAAVSSAGALGLMQVMPWWFDDLGVDGERWREPDVNVEVGATILAAFYAKEGSWAGALADYFGAGCDAYGTCTDDYVAAVLARVDRYASAF